MPADFRRFGRILRDLAPRVMATSAAPGLRRSEVSLSLHAGATVDELRRCGRDPDRVLIVERNGRLPRTHGLRDAHPHAIPLEEIDVLLDVDAEPFELPDSEPSATDRALAERALPYLEDGSTLQIGLGSVPDCIVSLLAEGPRGDFGVHSEMFTTGLMRLHRAGKVTNRKGHHDGYSVVTFAAGTRELYAWLDANEEVRFLPVDEVNAPSEIARNRSFVSINSALAVDLGGQVAADGIAGRQYSGAGGHEDFLAGAGRGGRSLICLPSLVDVEGRRESRIRAALPAGFPATAPRHQVDVVVTEHGAAELAGRTLGERARALAEIADPSVRSELLAEWRELGG